jgi:hypothetical protein
VAVPISDAYIIQYLVDGTREVPETICWREKSAEQMGYRALVEDVHVILEPVYSRAGSHLVLRFRHGGDEFTIHEPAAVGWLGRKFVTEDEHETARLFSELNTAVATQCATQRLRAERNREQIREQISRRLLFGQPETRHELSDAHRDRVRVG